jgi:hypothetical protein
MEQHIWTLEQKVCVIAFTGENLYKTSSFSVENSLQQRWHVICLIDGEDDFQRVTATDHTFCLGLKLGH